MLILRSLFTVTQKKTPKNNSLLFDVISVFRLMPEPIFQKPKRTSPVCFAQSAY